ncbi:IQ motif and SEC7 domain-containing protein 3-like [Hypomesus transpacificus]|uniref:IQ motif and SEC7 domain-containing protein 3-like n=1 Tax=Hypomesus transpacificus TaxID=137520 RepID=UPI001F0869B5|nr:IQ motif and SEC7 domain-containing protein 3-like [Hypomesus transpacificus]
MGLLGMHFHLFENEYYPHGITILSPFGCDKKQVLNFCAQSAEELLKFLEDLKESIAEVSEMEQIRIEWELEKQQGAKALASKNNGTQLELRAKQGSPSGKPDLEDKSGHNAVEVSIQNRHQMYQLSSSMPWSPGSVAPPNHQGELSHRPQLQPAAPTVADLQPETLIQCQQIVKVIVLDNSCHGRVEAFLSHTPTHHQHLHHQHLLQAAVSTPVSSSVAGGTQNMEGPQPPLPPPPPPYNHPHQYIPPDPRLCLQRTHSGSRSMV